jgi:hypothetical protein
VAKAVEPPPIDAVIEAEALLKGMHLISLLTASVV